MRNYDGKIVQKWSPIVSRVFSINESMEVCQIICHKLDKIARDNSDMSDCLLHIKEKLKDQRFNKKIVGDCINILTNEKGYILDGDIYYYQNQEMKNDDIIYLVGVDILKEIDPKGFRETRIESVIDEEN